MTTMRPPLLKRLALLGAVSLAICSACSHQQTKVNAKAPEPDGPVLVRVVSRNSTITARAGRNGPVYSMQTRDGRTVVPAMTLEQLEARRPDVARQLEVMTAADTASVFAGVE